MAKAVFRQGEIKAVSGRIIINPPALELGPVNAASEKDEAELEPEVEKYTGPTAEDLRREAEEYRVKWEAEKEEMLREAKDEADRIVQSANASGAMEKDLASEEANVLKQKAHEEAELLVAEARRNAEEIEVLTRKTLEDERKEAIEQGREAGRKEGYAGGMAEVERLIQRTQVVLERAQDKRGEILTETEQEIINLVLRITRKVVKVIADSQREVVISNVVQALRKVRDRGNVIIRVNLADLKLTTEHTKDFIRMLEGVKSIHVVEDTSVDAGGCVIETDFGEIDARISSQLSELETKILGISPIKSKIKSPSASNVRDTVNP
jgi:flagellar assembly protein FliH